MDRNQVIGIILLVAMFVGWMVYDSSRSNPNMGTSPQVENTENDVDKAIVEAEQTIDSTDRAQSVDLNVAEQNVTIRTNDIEVVLTNYGGKIKTVRLLKYTDYDNDTLVLMDGKSADIKIFGETQSSGNINLGSQVFQTTAKSSVVKNGDSISVIYTGAIAGGTVVKQVYSFKSDGYTIGYKLDMNNISKSFASNDLRWKFDA